MKRHAVIIRKIMSDGMKRWSAHSDAFFLLLYSNLAVIPFLYYISIPYIYNIIFCNIHESSEFVSSHRLLQL